MSTQPFSATAGTGTAPAGATPYRPANWSITPNTSLTVPNVPTTQGGTSVSSSATDENGNPLPGNNTTPVNTPNSPTSSGSTIYYFDAVLSVDHDTRLTITRHPVQNGSSIVDHAYQESARVILEVGFSDAMQAYSQGQYASNSSKSVSAYQTMVQIQSSRLPLTLTTRLQTYQNMLIAEIRCPDTAATIKGARMQIVFEQITLATVSTQTASARPNQNQTTPSGNVQPTPVPPTTTQNYTSSPTTPPFAPPVDNPNPLWNSNPGLPGVSDGGAGPI